MANLVRIEESWFQKLGEEFEKPYMKSLEGFLSDELSKGKEIFPPMPEIFSAFDLTPLDQVKVVVIGQDPYHGDGQAHGLSFSVRKGIQIPPSLRNMYKELQSDIGMIPPTHGHLEGWAKQGVLMLNAVLTVEAHQAASHRKKGWEQFTDKVVDVLNQHCSGLVFLLWGSFAQKKCQNIDRSKHFVLQAPHPSPLSASRGFFGCKHFSQANEYLKKIGKKEIQWELL